jgi:fatty acid desaturase
MTPLCLLIHSMFIISTRRLNHQSLLKTILLMFFHYAKFSLFHLLTCVTIVSVLLGHQWIVWGYIAITSFIVLGDTFTGDDIKSPEYRFPWILTAQLYLALPLLIALFLVSMWQVGKFDHFGIGSILSQLTGYEFLQAREQTQWWQYAIGVFFVGLMIATIGTITGHELVHRTWSKTSLVIGRWLLAFSFDANFSVEHVYGHHRHVATKDDPATAPRGRNVYTHIVLSSFYGNISAWNIEKARLKSKKLGLISIHNICIRGYLMSLCLVIASYLLAGPAGLAFFTLSGIWAKCMLEIVNYMEHYGLQRVPKKRVEPKHSWNTNRRISSWALFNLSRHSHHHANANIPFHNLSPYQSSPKMISGYLSTIIITLIPPLWFKMMQSRLADWDNHYANDQERALIAQQQKD